MGRVDRPLSGDPVMTNEDYGRLHRELGFDFSVYVTSHLDSPLLDHLTDETAVIFQTDDPEFNAAEWALAKQAQEKDDRPDRPVTVIYVRVPNPPSAEGAAWDQAKVLTRLIIKPEPASATV
jgi:hypothetical protein